MKGFAVCGKVSAFYGVSVRRVTTRERYFSRLWRLIRPSLPRQWRIGDHRRAIARLESDAKLKVMNENFSRLSVRIDYWSIIWSISAKYVHICIYLNHRGSFFSMLISCYFIFSIRKIIQYCLYHQSTLSKFASLLLFCGIVFFNLNFLAKGIDLHCIFDLA